MWCNIILTYTLICNVVPQSIFITPDLYICPIRECVSFNTHVDSRVTFQCVIVECHVGICNIWRGATVSCNNRWDKKTHTDTSIRFSVHYWWLSNGSQTIIIPRWVPHWTCDFSIVSLQYCTIHLELQGLFTTFAVHKIESEKSCAAINLPVDQYRFILICLISCKGNWNWSLATNFQIQLIFKWK